MKLFLALLLFVTIPTKADKPDAWASFIEGDYYSALTTGRKTATADSITVACRANLIIGGYWQAGEKATHALHSAIADCTKALELSPNHFDAQMSLAIALSFEGKRTRKPAYAKKAKLLLEDLVARFPENSVAYGALAAWHSQVSAAGFFARIALKASRKEAKRLFVIAYEKGVIDFPLNVEYLKFLAAGSKKERQLAIPFAQNLLKQKVVSKFDGMLQKKCVILLSALKSGKKRTIKKAIKEASAYSKTLNWEDNPVYPLENIPDTITG